jgi:hypothetical protein
MAQHIVAHEDTTRYAPYHSRWCAYDANSYDGPGCPIGFGPTETEAIDDLIRQLPEVADEDILTDERWS